MKPKPRSVMVLMVPSAMGYSLTEMCEKTGLACLSNMPGPCVIGHGHRAPDTFAYAHTRYLNSIPHTTLRWRQLCAGCWTLLVDPLEGSGLVSTAARAMLAAIDRVLDQSWRWLCVPGRAGFRAVTTMTRYRSPGPGEGPGRGGVGGCDLMR